MGVSVAVARAVPERVGVALPDSEAARSAKAVAACTLPTEGCRALPFVENDSNATLGRTPTSCRASCAVETAMSANCSTVGSGITPQSPINNTPFSPKRVSSTSIT